MGIKHRFAFWAVLVLPLAGAAAGSVDVPTVALQPGNGAGSFELDGSFQPVRQATLSAQVGGNVLLLAVKAGDRVKAGQLVARIDEREAQAGVLRNNAALAQAEAEASNARMHAERTRDLRGKGFVSQAALDTAETQLKAAQAGVQQAQAGRSQAALARGFAAANAPFDGVVLATHLDTGDLATPGRPIATIYAPGALRAVVQVPASQAAVARSAQRVEIELPGGQWMVPERSTELSSTDAVAQTVEWRLDLPLSAAKGISPGQSARVRFSGTALAVAAAPRLPVAAVLRRGELTAVYVAQGGQFVLRAVRLGADHGALGVDVLAGLQAGERVAADALKAGLAGARPVPVK